jgi:ribosomal protein S30
LHVFACAAAQGVAHSLLGRRQRRRRRQAGVRRLRHDGVGQAGLVGGGGHDAREDGKSMTQAGTSAPRRAFPKFPQCHKNENPPRLTQILGLQTRSQVVSDRRKASHTVRIRYERRLSWISIVVQTLAPLSAQKPNSALFQNLASVSVSVLQQTHVPRSFSVSVPPFWRLQQKRGTEPALQKGHCL